MLVERADIQVRPGSEEAFAAEMGGRGREILDNFPGVQAVRFGRGVESPDRFMLLIDWESMDAHMAFTKDPVFAEFRGLISPHSVGGAMEHFELS